MVCPHYNIVKIPLQINLICGRFFVGKFFSQSIAINIKNISLKRLLFINVKLYKLPSAYDAVVQYKSLASKS